MRYILICVRLIFVSSCADVAGSSLPSITLTSSKMWRSNMNNLDLTLSDLTSVFLFRSDLSGADMTSAILPNGDLQDLTFRGATMSSANFQSVKTAVCRYEELGYPKCQLQRC